MPEIRDRFNFEPDQNSLSKWLATRKSGFYAGNTPVPGYFEDYKNSTDLAWVVLAVIGEIIGIFLTIQGGTKKGGLFLIGSIILVLVFLACDAIFAVKLHRNAEKKCYIESLLYLLAGTDNQKENGYLLKKEDGKGYDFLLKLGIVFIAILKIVAIVLLGIFSNLLAYIPIFIIYLIVSYIHIQHTGYFWAYLSTSLTFEKQHKEYSQTAKHLAIQRDHSFESPYEFKLPISLGGEISIVEDSQKEIIINGEKFFKYILKTKGILLDSDIAMIMNGQGSSQRAVIAYEARKHQLQNMSRKLA